MADRRTEILEAAIALIVDEGYSSLTMRALAREVGMKLASLQYHFRTTDELMRGVVNHIGDAYDQSFEALRRDSEVITARQVVGFILEDEPGKAICGDRLWPQLWAMQDVEPLVSDLVENIYERFLEVLEGSLRQAGSSMPRVEALCLMSMLEGTTIFIGEGRRWQKHAIDVSEAILKLTENNWGPANEREP